MIKQETFFPMPTNEQFVQNMLAVIQSWLDEGNYQSAISRLSVVTSVLNNSAISTKRREDIEQEIVKIYDQIEDLKRAHDASLSNAQNSSNLNN